MPVPSSLVVLLALTRLSFHHGAPCSFDDLPRRQSVLWRLPRLSAVSSAESLEPALFLNNGAIVLARRELTALQILRASSRSTADQRPDWSMIAVARTPIAHLGDSSIAVFSRRRGALEVVNVGTTGFTTLKSYQLRDDYDDICGRGSRVVLLRSTALEVHEFRIETGGRSILKHTVPGALGEERRIACFSDGGFVITTTVSGIVSAHGPDGRLLWTRRAHSPRANTRRGGGNIRRVARVFALDAGVVIQSIDASSVPKWGSTEQSRTYVLSREDGRVQAMSSALPLLTAATNERAAVLSVERGGLLVTSLNGCQRQ